MRDQLIYQMLEIKDDVGLVNYIIGHKYWCTGVYSTKMASRALKKDSSKKFNEVYIKIRELELRLDRNDVGLCSSFVSKDLVQSDFMLLKKWHGIEKKHNQECGDAEQDAFSPSSTEVKPAKNLVRGGYLSMEELENTDGNIEVVYILSPRAYDLLD